MESYLRGTGTPEIRFHSTVGFCSGAVPTGRRLLFFLSDNGSLNVEPVDLCGGCRDNPELARVEQALRLAPGTLYSAGDGPETPWLPIIVSAVAIPIAVLTGAAIIRRRSRSG